MCIYFLCHELLEPIIGNVASPCPTNLVAYLSLAMTGTQLETLVVLYALVQRVLLGLRQVSHKSVFAALLHNITSLWLTDWFEFFSNPKIPEYEMPSKFGRTVTFAQGTPVSDTGKYVKNLASRDNKDCKRGRMFWALISPRSNT